MSGKCPTCEQKVNSIVSGLTVLQLSAVHTVVSDFAYLYLVLLVLSIIEIKILSYVSLSVLYPLSNVSLCIIYFGVLLYYVCDCYIISDGLKCLKA